MEEEQKKRLDQITADQPGVEKKPWMVRMLSKESDGRPIWYYYLVMATSEEVAAMKVLKPGFEAGLAPPRDLIIEAMPFDWDQSHDVLTLSVVEILPHTKEEEDMKLSIDRHAEMRAKMANGSETKQ